MMRVKNYCYQTIISICWPLHVKMEVNGYDLKKKVINRKPLASFAHKMAPLQKKNIVFGKKKQTLFFFRLWIGLFTLPRNRSLPSFDLSSNKQVKGNVSHLIKLHRERWKLSELYLLFFSTFLGSNLLPLVPWIVLWRFLMIALFNIYRVSG